MIKRELSLENNGFFLDGETFVCKDCPKGLKFTFKELDGMADALFLSTMKEHEKYHPIKFKPVFTEEKKSDNNKAEAPTENQVKDQSTKPVKKTPIAPSKKESSEIVLPAIPKVLLDAGMKNVLLAPRQAFVSAGGTEQEFAREINYAVQALLNNTFLLDCAKKEPSHFIEAIKNVGLSGLSLSPELKLGYLVPRKGKIYFNSSYMGKCEVITRGGAVSKVYARLVFEGEEFKVTEGTSPSIVHNPDPFGEKSIEKLLGGYWICKMANGEILFDTMPKARILEIRDIYSEGAAAKKGYTPWEKDSEALEMARKTIINWGYKFMPKTGLSEHQIKVLEITGEYDRDVMTDHVNTPEKQKADQFAEDGPADSNFSDAQIVD